MYFIRNKKCLFLCHAVTLLVLCNNIWIAVCLGLIVQLIFFNHMEMWPLLIKGFKMHTYRDTQHPFIMVITKDQWFWAISSGAVIKCVGFFFVLGLSRRGFAQQTRVFSDKVSVATYFEKNALCKKN